MNFTIGLCIVATMLVVVVRGYASKKASDRRPGSVADLVRRGQLRSDRRGMYDSNMLSLRLSSRVLMLLSFT